MSSLRRARMEEICVLVTDGTHDSPKLQKEGVPFIKGKNISGGTVDFTACDYITAEDHAEACRRVKPQRGDVLFSNIGSVGDTAVVRDDREFSIKNVALFRSDRSKVDPSYFYYLVLSPEFRTNVMNVRSGSAQPFITLGNLRSFEVGYVEEIGVQQRIASILSAYDELIENSQRRIKILEAMARGLYREWFVHFRFPGHENHPRVASSLGEIPEGWDVKAIKDFGKVITGKTPSKTNADFFGDDVPFIKTPDMHGNIFVLDTNESLSIVGAKSQSNKTLPVGSICVSCIGTIGVVSITTEECQTNQQINSVVLAKNEYREFLFFRLQEARQALENLGSNGATMGNVNKSKFESMEVVAPTELLLMDFHRLTQPLFKSIFFLTRQINNLRRTRDLLLPRLLSGQINVEAAEHV
jgi:type I restriction enzyme, S subunit